MDIIREIKRGDELAFKQAFDEYHEKLYFYVIGKTGSAYLAEETAQLTFMKLWKYRRSLNENFPLSLQLFRIAKTTLIDLLRKQNYSSSFISQFNHQNNGPEGTNVVEERMAFKELKMRIDRHIKKLPPTCKHVFLMNRYDDKSYSEIAEELSISVKTVEMHISKALRQLRSAINILLLLFPLLNEIIKKISE